MEDAETQTELPERKLRLGSGNNQTWAVIGGEC